MAKVNLFLYRDIENWRLDIKQTAKRRKIVIITGNEKLSRKNI